MHRAFSAVKKCAFFFICFLVFVGLAYRRKDFGFRFIIEGHSEPAPTSAPSRMDEM
jgi:hypothetical protein